MVQNLVQNFVQKLKMNYDMHKAQTKRQIRKRNMGYIISLGHQMWQGIRLHLRKSSLNNLALIFQVYLSNTFL